MNMKIIFAGGLAMYVAQFAVGMISGAVIHEGILDAAYQANAGFWRPELIQDPPDMAALMPLWISTGVIGSLIIAGIYGTVRNSFAGSGWLNGMKFGVMIWLVHVVAMAGWSGVFNLPYMIWGWWGAEALVYMLVGGAALGFVAEKVAPRAA